VEPAKHASMERSRRWEPSLRMASVCNTRRDPRLFHIVVYIVGV
jgi:hypothetical protein